MSIAPECRDLARLGISQATVLSDDQGSVRLQKKRNGRSRDDVAVCGVLASGSMIRNMSRPAQPLRFTLAG